MHPLIPRPLRYRDLHRPRALLLVMAVAAMGLAAAGVARAGAPHIGVHLGVVDTDQDPNDRVNVGHDSDLPAGQHAHSVVAVFGSASSEGDATGDVVSVFGNTRVTGTDTRDAVSVLGSTYVDSHIEGDAVAVLGSVRLGPHAEIDGDVTAVGGTVELAAGANVHGQVQQVASGMGSFGAAGMRWMAPWGRHALLFLRPLGWGPGLGWAWAVAAVFLALYVFLALLAPGAVTSCEHTLREHPGATVLTAVLAVLATPFALMALLISVIAMPAIPVLLLALLCAGLFGKAVMLAWLGRRCLSGARAGATVHPALAVLAGGIIVLALYLVPVLGFVVYNVLGLLGLGVVIYTLILGAQARRSSRAGAGSAPGAGGPGGGATASSAAAGASAAGPSMAAASEAASRETASSVNASAPPAQAPSASPRVPVATLPRAGFWVRMVALLIDAILIGIVVHELPHSHNFELLALAIYGAVMWKLRGATLGGIIFDLELVRLDGREVDWTTAIVRALGCFLSLIMVGLGFIWIAFDEEKQAWHDKFAGTVVVRRLARAPAPIP